MAYQGWRIKLNGTIFPNEYMSRGSYSCVESKRIVETWTDADFTEHEEVAQNKQTQIRFSIRQHDSSEHATMCSLINEDRNILVDFYSDREDSYRTGIFRMDNVEFKHMNAVGNNIEYEAAQVVLTEY